MAYTQHSSRASEDRFSKASVTAGDEQPNAFDLVRAALGNGKSQVCCQGAVRLDSPPVIHGEAPDGSLFAVHLPLKDAKCSHDGVAREALQPLLDACVPASFGRGTEEVLDDSYRKALALPPDRFATSFSLAATDIVSDVHELLMPDAPRISARLHKMNVYEPGCFFKAHKDTPRSNDQFGSLVVCLPVPHKGGALAIRHGGREQARTEWGSDADTHGNTTVRWAAFYSDCEHEVEPVTVGHRVTLTYELTAEKAAPAGQQRTMCVSEAAARGTPLFSVLESALQDAEFFPRGGTLGVACNHQYAMNTRGCSLTPDMLKGGDALAFAVGTQLELRPKLALVYKDEGWEAMLHAYDADEALDCTIYMVKEVDLGGIPPDLCLGDCQRDILQDEAGFRDATAIRWLNAAQFHFDNQHPCTYYGNEMSAGCFYTAAGILLQVPSVRHRSIRFGPVTRAAAAARPSGR